MWFRVTGRGGQVCVDCWWGDGLMCGVSVGGFLGRILGAALDACFTSIIANMNNISSLVTLFRSMSKCCIVCLYTLLLFLD